MSQNTTAEDVVDSSSETVAPEEAGVVAAQDDAGSGDQGSDEGEIAADYLEEMLDIVDLDGDIEIEIRGDRTFISIQAEEGSEELQGLVGHKGEVLDALQELTRLAVLTATGRRSTLILDINGHRAARHRELKEIAENAAASVRDTGEKRHLDPMSAFERKIVHDFIAEAGLISESEGEGKRRHVVVHPGE